MAFGTGYLDEIGKVGSGEILGTAGVVTSYNTFEEGLKGGLFSKYANGGVELVDGSATPVIAGVVKREVTSAIENGGTYTSENNIYADIIESGLVTVEVVAGLTIDKFEPVYVSNGGDANDGKATNVSTDNATVDGYFYQEVSANVWAIRLK